MAILSRAVSWTGHSRPWNKSAQSTIEYALLIAIAAAAVMAMQLYMQRAAKASFKVLEDQITPRAINTTP